MILLEYGDQCREMGKDIVDKGVYKRVVSKYIDDNSSVTKNETLKTTL